MIRMSLPSKFLLPFICVVWLAAQAQAAATIHNVETASGHTVWLVEDHTLPVITIKLAFPKSGAAQDPSGKAGLASFLSQMLDEGAGELNAVAFRQALENKAIRFAVDGGQDMITVTMQTLSQHKDEALDLLMMALTKPRFDSEAVERIRASILSDLTQLEEEPMYIASRRWKEITFAGSHPYRFPRRGTVDSVKSITAEDLRAFSKNHFFTDKKPVIAVVGDITQTEVEEWDFPNNPANALDNLADITMPQATDTPVIVSMNVPQTVVIASLPGLKRTDPKYPALQLLNQVMGGNSITSRLGSEVRNKRGLVYHIGSDLEVMDHAAFISASFATRNAQASEALTVFKTIVSDLANKGITPPELRDAKNYLIGSFPLEHDTQNELAGTLVGIQYFNLGQDYMDKRASLLEKVTLADVNTLAKDLLSRVPLVVMAGSPESSPTTSSAPKAE